MGESTVVGFDADKVFDSLKVRTLFERAGAEVVNLDRDAAIEIKIPHGDVLKKIKVCRTAYESDVIISVPKLKISPSEAQSGWRVLGRHGSGDRIRR